MIFPSLLTSKIPSVFLTFTTWLGMYLGCDILSLTYLKLLRFSDNADEYPLSNWEIFHFPMIRNIMCLMLFPFLFLTPLWLLLCTCWYISRCSRVLWRWLILCILSSFSSSGNNWKYLNWPTFSVNLLSAQICFYISNGFLFQHLTVFTSWYSHIVRYCSHIFL